ncbi:MAG: haloacid dehalogenase, partial [Candidatus Electrothrix sp. AR4]|nr:haloacid dehalogenase [Candidatus Electrothrix sp. AR4]
PAVLVANARREVAKKAEEIAKSTGNTAMLCLARGNFRGMNGCYSAGILEGVAHYYPDLLQSAP